MVSVYCSRNLCVGRVRVFVVCVDPATQRILEKKKDMGKSRKIDRKRKMIGDEEMGIRIIAAYSRHKPSATMLCCCCTADFRLTSRAAPAGVPF